MITISDFPTQGPKPLYYSTHIKYVENIFKQITPNISYNGSGSFNYFNLKFMGKDIIIDFSDYDEVKVPNIPYFKFHWNKEKHERLKNVHSFTPISFYDWEQFIQIRKEISYTCNNDKIISIQRKYGLAFERRSYVQKILQTKYKEQVVLSGMNQMDYWKTINNCLVHVFVPGARNNMLDRGHLQYLSFGCCTISPLIIDCLAYNSELIPGTHYVQCLDDYSDLYEKIEWCKENRRKCKEIGQNAKDLFEVTSTPKKIYEWILRKTHE